MVPSPNTVTLGLELQHINAGHGGGCVFSHLVVSDSLSLHGQQHTSLPCPSPSPEVCPSSCLLLWWCHPAISSSDTLFFCPQSFPASGTFPMSWLLSSDDQNTGASASASVLPTSIQGWFPLRLTGLISLLSKVLSGVFSSTPVRRHQFFGILYGPNLITMAGLGTQFSPWNLSHIPGPSHRPNSVLNSSYIDVGRTYILPSRGSKSLWVQEWKMGSIGKDTPR